eukprot:821000_1
MAIGAHNGSIWLAGGGGGSGATELIKINIITETASSYDSNGYTFGNLGAQMWFQRGTVLFTSYYLKGAIRGFDLSSMTVTHIITKYDTVYDGAHCLTGNNDYLFTVGGWSGDIYVDAFYIYNFISEEWFVGPSIPQNRKDHGCNVLNELLYVIGGSFTPTESTNSVIFIDISDPYNNPTWNVFPDTLSIA